MLCSMRLNGICNWLINIFAQYVWKQTHRHTRRQTPSAHPPHGGAGGGRRRGGRGAAHGGTVSGCTLISLFNGVHGRARTCTRARRLFIHERRAGQKAYFANGGAGARVSGEARATAVWWSRPHWPTCAWLYPEPLCRQETTILTLAASQEPSSTEGGTENWQGRKTAKRGGKKGKNTSESKQRRRLGEDEGERRLKERDGGGRQWTYRSRPAEIVFVSEWKAALLGRWRDRPFAVFFHGWRKGPLWQAVGEPLSRRTLRSMFSHCYSDVSRPLSPPAIVRYKVININKSRPLTVVCWLIC